MVHQGKMLNVPVLILMTVLIGNSAAAPRAPARIDSSEARIGRCHMDSCWWFSIRSRSLVRRDESGTLYRFSWLNGSSDHRNGRYPRNARGVRILWERVSHQGFEFCSRRLQASIEREDGQLVAHVLSFPPAGFEEGALNIHAAICYPGVSTETPNFGRRFGYGFHVPSLDYRLERPEDIFRFAREAHDIP
jgi:hypothetical protein